ncbi:MAG: metal ABC transporter permease [Calditrichia bacterium]|nr:metal ABC transporter permease [Calditrichia bacterium]
MIDLIIQLFNDYTLRTVALGSGILGIVSGALGSYAMLRKQSLLGDAISHAALPGIAIAFLLTLSKSPLVLVLGAAISGWIGTLFILTITKSTRIKEDSALGLVLSVFFGFGLVLLTFIQRKPYASKAGLDKFLFGQAAALLESDVIIMGVLSIFVLLLVSLFWKEFKLLSFNPEFAASLGFPVRFLDILLTNLLVIAIVIGLQTVGVVLMSAMVVAPAAAARQWTDRLGKMIILSSLFGALAGVSGAFISSTLERLPTGPTIVLCMSILVFISILFATNRGLFWRWLREQNNRRQLQIDAILSDLYILAKQHQSIEHGHPIEVLRTMSIGHGGVDRTLKELRKGKLVEQKPNGTWMLTSKGLSKAEEIESGGGSE